VEIVGALAERYGKLLPALKLHREPKKRAQGNGGPPQKFAAAHGRWKRHAIPAPRKGHGRKGPDKTIGNETTRRSLKQRAQDKVVRGTATGRTFEERRRTQMVCNNGTRDKVMKQRLCLGNEKTLDGRTVYPYEALRQKFKWIVLRKSSEICPDDLKKYIE
jgi:hypothetical protein